MLQFIYLTLNDFDLRGGGVKGWLWGATAQFLPFTSSSWSGGPAVMWGPQHRCTSWLIWVCLLVGEFGIESCLPGETTSPSERGRLSSGAVRLQHGSTAPSIGPWNTSSPLSSVILSLSSCTVSTWHHDIIETPLIPSCNRNDLYNPCSNNLGSL